MFLETGVMVITARGNDARQVQRILYNGR